ncbi:hypothetical protein SM124_03495 (plasmid) [Bacillus sp. 31A1R]|uniref:Type IV pilus assembly protein PilN n=1 Tax=Robertmurraya mangrovi TaxID=3098077 RepID=A0ABU5IUK4_9BACI|nr:hypothetical protein [Bacillus sp. 31A1R]MDZ5470810.1 hypothetical protein [Bacillus sp. 31A1R]
MLVDINLLPTKEPKNKTLLMLVILLGIILISGVTSLYLLKGSYDKEITSITNEINRTQQVIAEEQQKIIEFEESNSVTELKNAVNWAKEYPIKTIPLIKHLTGLLPERGFIQSFTYEETGEIKLTVQFDTSREAAFYLKNLLDSNWINEVFLETVTTKELNEQQEMDDLESDEIIKYTPRYIGEYKLLINKQIIKEELDSSDNTESSEQGGEDS